MPEKTGRKRKVRNEKDKKNQTYSQKLRKRMLQSDEKSKEVQDRETNLHKEEVQCTLGNDDFMNNNRVCETADNDPFSFQFKPRVKEPTIHGFTPLVHKSENLLHFLQQYSRGQKATVSLRKSLASTVINRISELQLCRKASPFDRRVTAMEWHPTNPNVLAVGSKGGDIMLWDTVNVDNDKFVQGIGAGGNIQAMKFWPGNDGKLLAAGLDGRVTVHDMEGRQSQILTDTMNFYDFWYCSVDINPSRKLVVAGDNVGNTQLMTYDGHKVFNFRLHKNKVTHTEFSPREDWLLCTASTDQTVQFWDVRMMKDRKSSLHLLKHDKAVNSAYFSGTDGCCLLTTDQNNQIRVYRAPAWTLERTILHPHRFFRHITPIKATWHPLQDLAVIGRYPDPKFPGYHDGELRSIDVIDVESGELVTSLYDPTAPGLVSVNKFNRRGDALASGMGVNILLWTRKEEVEERQTALISAMKSYIENSNQNNSGNSRRQPRQPKTKDTKTKNVKQKSDTKTEKEKLKMKLNNTKK